MRTDQSGSMTIECCLPRDAVRLVRHSTRISRGLPSGAGPRLCVTASVSPRPPTVPRRLTTSALMGTANSFRGAACGSRLWLYRHLRKRPCWHRLIWGLLGPLTDVARPAGVAPDPPAWGGRRSLRPAADRPTVTRPVSWPPTSPGTAQGIRGRCSGLWRGRGIREPPGGSGLRTGHIPLQRPLSVNSPNATRVVARNTYPSDLSAASTETDIDLLEPEMSTV